MQQVYVRNFTRTEELEVFSNSYDNIGPTVSMQQRAGSCWFQFSMNPNQARYLAKALIEHADYIEDAE